LLYSIFDEPRVFSFGNDKTEAVENARLGLERMERNSELRIRMTRPVSGGAVDTKVIAGGIANPSNTITFGNDLMVTAR